MLDKLHLMAVNMFVISSLMIVTWAGFFAFIGNHMRLGLTVLLWIYCAILVFRSI
jgi:hypothetical protein